MAYNNGPKIVTDGLRFCLDAGNSKSYPGTGSTWLDITSKRRSVTLSGTYSFSDNSILATTSFAYGVGPLTTDILPINNVNVSVGAWVKPSISTQIGQYLLQLKRSTTNDGSTWITIWVNGNTAGGSGVGDFGVLRRNAANTAHVSLGGKQWI